MSDQGSHAGGERDARSAGARKADARSAEARAATDARRRAADPLFQVRAGDLEPYTGLGYLSKLFRLIAVVLLVLLVAEAIAGATSDDPDWWRTLLGEASRFLVVAGVLWGAGDLATLLIDIGHDVRATRVLLGRQVAHAHDAPHAPRAPDAGAADHRQAAEPAERSDERAAAGGVR